MDREKRRKATELLVKFGESLSGMDEKGGVLAAREALVDATRTLGDEAASWKASDYAVARTHAKIARLIGYGDLELSDASRAAWRDFEDFVYGEARDDLRGVGGLNLG